MKKTKMRKKSSATAPPQAARKNAFDVRMAAPKIGEVLIYGDIASYEFWGDEMTPQALINAVKALGAIDELHIRVFSYGGSAYAGSAMYAYLNSLNVKKVGYVDGIAASAATMPLMACETVYMDEAAVLLIHLPMIRTNGNMDELRRAADEIETVSNLYAGAYAKKSGRSDADMLALMREDRLLSPAEAMEYGLCDATFESNEKTARYDPEDEAYAALIGREDVKAWDARRAQAEAHAECNDQDKKENGGTKNMTREELMEQDPELVQALLDEGAAAERTRMQEIDDLALEDGELVNAAKYGENRMDAKSLAFEAIKQAKGKPAAAMRARMEDAAETTNAGAQQTTPEGDGKDAKRKDNAELLASAMKRIMGVK